MLMAMGLFFPVLAEHQNQLGKIVSGQEMQRWCVVLIEGGTANSHYEISIFWTALLYNQAAIQICIAILGARDYSLSLSNSAVSDVFCEIRQADSGSRRGYQWHGMLMGTAKQKLRNSSLRGRFAFGRTCQFHPFSGQWHNIPCGHRLHSNEPRGISLVATIWRTIVNADAHVRQRSSAHF